MHRVTARAAPSHCEDYPDEPIHVRLAEKCAEVSALTDELLADFTTEEANPILWAEPVVRRVQSDVEAILRKLVF